MVQGGVAQGPPVGPFQGRPSGGVAQVASAVPFHNATPFKNTFPSKNVHLVNIVRSKECMVTLHKTALFCRSIHQFIKKFIVSFGVPIHTAQRNATLYRLRLKG